MMILPSAKPLQSVPMLVAVILVSVALQWGSSLCLAAQLYRYTDEHGNVVMSSSIPAQYVGKGYDILNEHGRLVERVAPALTKEQIALRDAEQARQEKLKLEQAAQAKFDEELKLLYSHPNDAVRILKRRILDIKSLIQLKRNKIESNDKLIVEQESEAASRQRNGQNIPETVLASIAKLKNETVNARADIVELNSEFAKVLKEFDVKIKRLEFITKKEASDYPALLEDLKSNQTK